MEQIETEMALAHLLFKLCGRKQHQLLVTILQFLGEIHAEQ